MPDTPKRLTRGDFEFRWERRIVWPVALMAGILLSECAPEPAHAGTIGVHAYSAHFWRDDDAPDIAQPSDFTPGLYWRGDSGITLGVVRNSFRRPSFYAAYTFEHGRWGLTVGGITGYEYRHEVGPKACGRKEIAHNVVPASCGWDVGATHSKVRPLIAPSVAFPEAVPYIGAVPRIALLGKALSLSLEWGL